MRLGGERKCLVWVAVGVVAAGCSTDGEEAAPAAVVAEAESSGQTAWFTRLYGWSNQSITAVVPAPDGDVYIAGTFGQELRWDRDDALFQNTSAPRETPFVARVSAENGAPVWIHTDLEVGTAFGLVLAVDPDHDEVLVAGYASAFFTTMGGTDLGCGRTQHAHFWTVLNGDGRCVASGSFEQLEPRGADINAAVIFPDGHIGLAGGLYGAMRIAGQRVDPPPGHSVLEGVPYVFSLQRDGQLRNATLLEPVGDLAEGTAGEFYAMASDAFGSAYAVGVLRRPVIDSQEGFSAAPKGPYSALAMRVTSTGVPIRIETYGSEAIATAVAVARDGTHVIGGTFRGSIDFGGGVASSFVGATPDPFVVKRLYESTPVWMRRFSGSASASVGGVSLDDRGFVGVAGSFADGRLHIGSTVYENTAGGAFVARLGANSGSTVWSRGFTSVNDIGVWDVAATTNRRLVVGGTYFGNADFGRPVAGDLEGDGYLIRLLP